MTAPPPPDPRAAPLPWFLAALLALVGGAAIVAAMVARVVR